MSAEQLKQSAFPTAEIKNETLKGQCEQLLRMFESFTRDQKTKLEEAFDDCGVNFDFSNIQETLFEVAKVLSSLYEKPLEIEVQNKINAGKNDYNAFGAKVLDLTEGKSPLGIAQTYERLSSSLPELKEILDQVGHPEAEAIAKVSTKASASVRSVVSESEEEKRVAVEKEAKRRIIDLQLAVTPLIDFMNRLKETTYKFTETSYQMFKDTIQQLEANLSNSGIDFSKMDTADGEESYSYTDIKGILAHAKQLVAQHENSEHRSAAIATLNTPPINEIQEGLERESGGPRINHIPEMVQKLQYNLAAMQAYTERQLASYDGLVAFRAQLLEAMIMHFALKYADNSPLKDMNLYKGDVISLLRKYNANLKNLQDGQFVSEEVLSIDENILDHNFVGFYSNIKATLPAGREVLEDGEQRLAEVQAIRKRIAEVRKQYPTSLMDRLSGKASVESEAAE